MEASPEHVSKLAWNIAAPARCSKPVIAANRGYAFGVGFEISLACDFRIVSETCFYALPEQKLGQIPGSGGSARLQKIVGVTRTKDIVMRSKRIPGKQALRLGHRHRMRCRRQARGGDRRAGRRAARLLADRPAHGEEAAQRHRRCNALDRHRARGPLPTAGCASPTISAKASRPSTPSARRNSREAERSAGGGSGIRTHVTVSRKHAFQACAFSHSATPPHQLSQRRTPFRSRRARGALMRLQPLGHPSSPALTRLAPETRARSLRLVQQTNVRHASAARARYI